MVLTLSVQVAECRQVLVDAIVEDGSKQDTRHFWCYFCNHEYQRDKKLENMLLKEAAMIEHLARLDINIYLYIYVAGVCQLMN